MLLPCYLACLALLGYFSVDRDNHEEQIKASNVKKEVLHVADSLRFLSSVIGGPSIQTGPAPSNPMLGNILIVCAQVIVAIQMVVEEKILGKYKINALQVCARKLKRIACLS